jgi:hypothetical protein
MKKKSGTKNTVTIAKELKKSTTLITTSGTFKGKSLDDAVKNMRQGKERVKEEK